jgi:phosphate acyltransferase
MKIALDIPGGDFAPKATALGAVLAQKELPSNVKLVLIGNEEETRQIISGQNVDADLFEYVHTTEVIGMGEHPTKALAQKPTSSISIGFHLLKEKKIDAFCSAGNSGAMMVGAMFTIKAIPGVIRPTILSEVPKFNGGLGLILDVGINADCKPDVLYQFGVIGSVYAENYLGIKEPKVALMNIGEEPEKGNLVAQAAFNLMDKSKDFNFVGNVEGRDLFNDKADVIVCDGFTGNIILKQAEAFYRMIKKRGIEDEYFNRFNYELYGGTPVLGVNGTVLVGHGISNDVAIKNMLLQAQKVTKAQITEKIKQFFN